MLPAMAQQSYNVSFTHEGKTVFGTFTVPNASGQFPTIIINPGTGANDRDGTLTLLGGNSACLYPGLVGTTLRPYKQLSDALVNAGYAVLRYDKLEYTYTAPGSLDPITFRKLWLPVESAIDYVKTRNDVDTSNIVLIGHSEGSSIIPYIAKNRNDIKALVSIAGPRTPLDSLLAYQFVYIATTCNGNIPQAEAQAAQVLSYFNTIRTNQWNAGTPDFAGVSASTWYDYILAVDSVAINYNFCNLPTLFTGLGDDFNVPPSELTRFQDEVSITNDFWSISNLNHFMTTSDNPDVSKTLTDTIIYWLSQHIMTSGGSDPTFENIVFEVFPNPFTDEFSVSIHNLQIKNLEISISDITGRELIRRQAGSADGFFTQRFNMALFPDGAYVLSIIADGQQVTKKIIKK